MAYPSQPSSSELNGTKHSPQRGLSPQCPCPCPPPSSAVLPDSLGSAVAQLRARQQSDAPSLLRSPNVLKLKPVWQEIWPQWCQGWQSAHCPTAYQTWPAGWGLLPFYPGFGSDQTGTVGPPGSHVAWRPFLASPCQHLQDTPPSPLRRGQQWCSSLLHQKTP